MFNLINHDATSTCIFNIIKKKQNKRLNTFFSGNHFLSKNIQGSLVPYLGKTKLLHDNRTLRFVYQGRYCLIFTFNWQLTLLPSPFSPLSLNVLRSLCTFVQSHFSIEAIGIIVAELND